MTHSQLSAIASELKKIEKKEKNKKGRKVLIKIFRVCVIVVYGSL